MYLVRLKWNLVWSYHNHWKLMSASLYMITQTLGVVLFAGMMPYVFRPIPTIILDFSWFTCRLNHVCIYISQCVTFGQLIISCHSFRWICVDDLHMILWCFEIGELDWCSGCGITAFGGKRCRDGNMANDLNMVMAFIIYIERSM